MKYIVTGGLGFFGSAMVAYLLRQPNTDEILIIDNNSKNTAKGPLPFLPKDKKLTMGRQKWEPRLVWENISLNEEYNTPYIAHHLEKGYDNVYCFAANVGGVLYLNKYPFSILDDNNRIMGNLLNACKISKFKGRILFISSSMVYENTTTFPSTEESASLPNSPYGLSKLSGEYLCESFWREHGLDYIVVRPFNLWGGTDYSKEVGMSHLIPDMIRKILSGQGSSINTPLEVYGNGSQIRNYIHIDDAVAVLYELMKLSPTREIYNLCTEKALNVMNVIEIIWNKINPGISFSDIYLKFLPGFKHDIAQNNGSIQKVKNLLGWCPKISIEQNVDTTIKFVKECMKND